ncbi:unnamed protein product, partial [Amoebophrya sp. A120]
MLDTSGVISSDGDQYKELRSLYMKELHESWDLAQKKVTNSASSSSANYENAVSTFRGLYEPGSRGAVLNYLKDKLSECQDCVDIYCAKVQVLLRCGPHRHTSRTEVLARFLGKAHALLSAGKMSQVDPRIHR